MISRGVPASKIVVGIPTFGRTWELKSGSTSTGVPPIAEKVNGPAPAGIQSKKEGLLTYAEICSKLTNAQNKELKGENGPLRKVGDPTKRYGTYAYRLPDNDGNFGMWVGYEDADTAGNKASYVRAKNLGGVSIFDLSQDDFRGKEVFWIYFAKTFNKFCFLGSCSGDKFPILRAARNRLV